ncbi:MAG TPA: hypothetical protein VM325_18765 [Alphaproteobacteria bacterium]|nr:hypothetical protein [Alphaproteobacteria bacterium]
MSALKNLTLALALTIAAMTFAASPTLAGEAGDLATQAERAGLFELAQGRAPRCRRRCDQRQRECHTERRCGYTTGCRNVQVCRSVCLHWENYPYGCR